MRIREIILIWGKLTDSKYTLGCEPSISTRYALETVFIELAFDWVLLIVHVVYVLVVLLTTEQLRFGSDKLQVYPRSI